MIPKKIVIISGAGISAESGIKTFRDSNGLWEGHNVQDVATPEGWARNPALVLDFYNQRRRQLHEVLPNVGHHIIADLEHDFQVQIITQNVDNLHEKAGSTMVLHLHGELLKVRSCVNKNDIRDWNDDLNLGDCDALGHQLRPHIVWFGEAVPAIEIAVQIVESADVLIIVGTSMQVYPAASLIDFAPENIPIYYIDPNPAPVSSNYHSIKIVKKIGSKGLKIVQEALLKMK